MQYEAYENKGISKPKIWSTRVRGKTRSASVTGTGKVVGSMLCSGKPSGWNSMLGLKYVITKHVKICANCSYVRCATLIVE